MLETKTNAEPSKSRFAPQQPLVMSGDEATLGKNIIQSIRTYNFFNYLGPEQRSMLSQAITALENLRGKSNDKAPNHLLHLLNARSWLFNDKNA